MPVLHLENQMDGQVEELIRKQFCNRVVDPCQGTNRRILTERKWGTAHSDSAWPSERPAASLREAAPGSHLRKRTSQT